MSSRIVSLSIITAIAMAACGGPEEDPADTTRQRTNGSVGEEHTFRLVDNDPYQWDSVKFQCGETLSCDANINMEIVNISYFYMDLGAQDTYVGLASRYLQDLMQMGSSQLQTETVQTGNDQTNCYFIRVQQPTALKYEVVDAENLAPDMNPAPDATVFASGFLPISMKIRACEQGNYWENEGMQVHVEIRDLPPQQGLAIRIGPAISAPASITWGDFPSLRYQDARINLTANWW